MADQIAAFFENLKRLPDPVAQIKVVKDRFRETDAPQLTELLTHPAAVAWIKAHASMISALDHQGAYPFD